MATATTIPTAQQTAALELSDAPANVRELDPEHVQALTGSIALQGILVSLVVRPVGERFELVAGFHRLAAATELGLAEVPVVVRDSEQEAADRAVENIARKQLNPCEEALAVQAMLGKGLSEDGAGQALGWPQTAGRGAGQAAGASSGRAAADRHGRDRFERGRVAAGDRAGLPSLAGCADRLPR